MTADDRREPRGRVALCGFMGAGKSTVAALLAARLGWGVVDTDRAIVRAAGRPVAEIFALEGEAAFRAREALAVAAALESERVVIALGGGALTGSESRARVLARCDVVYLRARAATLEARLAADATPRPLAGRGFPVALFEARRAGYEEAHLTVDTDAEAPQAIAERIAAALAAGRSRAGS